jgi:hypothetical protein
MINVMNLFVTVMNYQHIFGQCTNHMALYLIFIVALMPKIVVPTETLGVRLLLKGARDMQTMTPATFFQTFEEHSEALPHFYTEAAEDVQDLTDFYHLTFEELRSGQRKSPRLFKLPSY